jgi:hypothetical protein
MQNGKRIEELVNPQVDMPDPEVEDIAALTARLDALESRIRRSEQQQHGTSPL